jgi:alanine-glyoxylate transaminase/serine-glyoxylate transaminase/serine-pyruvate transaminase
VERHRDAHRAAGGFRRGDWRHGADPAVVYAKLADDRSHAIKAVCVVHNETSTGVVSRIGEIRKQIDAARHPALLLVDTISSLGSIEYRHDAWGVDVTVGCSQKGLMLPPGISFNAISDKALAAARSAKVAASLLGLGADAPRQQGGLLSRTRRRPTSSTACAKRSA